MLYSLVNLNHHQEINCAECWKPMNSGIAIIHKECENYPIHPSCIKIKNIFRLQCPGCRRAETPLTWERKCVKELKRLRKDLLCGEELKCIGMDIFCAQMIHLLLVSTIFWGVKAMNEGEPMAMFGIATVAGMAGGYHAGKK